MRPEVILMDEPCSAIDPIATAKIEELVVSLKRDCMVVFDYAQHATSCKSFRFYSFSLYWRAPRYASTKDIFENSKSEITEKYITGKFG